MDFKNVSELNSAWWFIIAGEQFLVIPNGISIPNGSLKDLPFPVQPNWQLEAIGEHQGEPCWLLDLGNDPIDMGIGEYQSLRWLLGRVDTALFAMAGRAWQMAHFLRTHRYCGQCGQAMQRIDWEVAMQCPSCQHRAYPRISPCVIVAIRKEQQILLACHQRHRRRADEAPLYTVLAGFVEAGETLEQCVAREVQEESGIQVKNIRYHGSQPWPFPHSLMMGFTADYAGGELRRDERELVDVGWYDFSDLPRLPGTDTIARQLIEIQRKRCR